MWLLVAGGALLGCHGGGPARTVAEQFLDAHYVEIDLEAAKQHCVGVARAKVEEEQRLVGDQHIDASTRRPHVGYRFVEQRDEAPDRVTFIYDGTVRFDDGTTSTLRWLVTTRQDADGSWKVSNYQDVY